MTINRRAAILNPDQMREFLTTGQVPKDARMVVCDDLGNPLDGPPPGHAYEKVGFVPDAPVAANTNRETGLGGFTQPEVTRAVGRDIAAQAHALADKALGPIDTIALAMLGTKMIMAGATLPHDGTGAEQFARNINDTLSEAFKYGYACAAAAALVGKIK